MHLHSMIPTSVLLASVAMLAVAACRTSDGPTQPAQTASEYELCHAATDDRPARANARAAAVDVLARRGIVCDQARFAAIHAQERRESFRPTRAGNARKEEGSW